MNTYVKYALISGVPLLAFLLLRPLIGRLGDPTLPNTAGTSSVALPESLPTLANLDDGPRARKDLELRDVTHWQALEEVERQILRFTNEKRRVAGLEPVDVESDLTKIARAHGLDMCARNFFAHTNPDGQGPMDRITVKHRTLIGTAGENLWKARGYDLSSSEDLALKIVEDWMTSVGHRANILGSGYTHLGVGAVVVDKEIWVVQNFARIVAYLDRPLPWKYDSDTILDLNHHTLQEGLDSATTFDLWSAKLGYTVMEPQPLGQPLPAVALGAYKLRLYFRSGKVIFFGPQIEVIQP